MGAIGYVPSLDVYGEVMACRGDRSLVPFRYQGQYEDAETRLYLSTRTNITKGAMKEIEATKVRQLRSEGHNLPYNRERDHRYHSPSYS